MTRFLQFGTSRFLQAHADLFIGEALGQDQVTVVHSSGCLAPIFCTSIAPAGQTEQQQIAAPWAAILYAEKQSPDLY